MSRAARSRGGEAGGVGTGGGEQGAAERIYTAHKVCAYAVLAAVDLHVTRAVKHALEENPEVLRRML